MMGRSEVGKDTHNGAEYWIQAEHTLQHNTHADRIVQNSLKNGELQQDLQEGAPLIQFVNKKKGNNLPIEKPKVVQ